MFFFLCVGVGCCGRVENLHPTVRDKNHSGIRTRGGCFSGVCGKFGILAVGNRLGRDVNRYCCLGAAGMFFGSGEK